MYSIERPTMCSSFFYSFFFKRGVPLLFLKERLLLTAVHAWYNKKKKEKRKEKIATIRIVRHN